MIYNILYTNFSKWRKVIFWEQKKIIKYEVWIANKSIYIDLLSLHGNFNLLKYGHHGLEASTMICLFAAYSFLSKPDNIDRLFLDNIIRTGIDLYQAFLNTEKVSINSKNRYKLILEFEIISNFFKGLYNIQIYDTSSIGYNKIPNLNNFHEWIYDNLELFTNRVTNFISDYACIILVNYESMVIFWNSQSQTYYLYDPHGKGLAFFILPPDRNQNFFITTLNQKIEFSDMSSYILKTQNYSDIITFIKKNISDQGNFSSWYITL